MKKKEDILVRSWYIFLMIVCKNSGSVSSVGWLFDKKGKIVFATGESGHSLEQMMDEAIEAGAEDIEDNDDLVEVNN